MMPQQYSDKLARFGVDIPPERVLTSAQATAAYLSGVSPLGTRIYAIGRDGIRSALEDKGFVLTEEQAEYVVVGWDRELTWKKLCTAALLIHGGARFVGTNPDNSYPTEEGPAPGNGAQLAALEATTGIAPTIVGKPEPWLYAEAMRRMGASPETTATVGDRLETDIAGGKRVGLTTILVLSGIATRRDLTHAAISPDLVFEDSRDLVRVWREQLRRHGQEQSSRHAV
jgi:4-nitrophenyl phosphatase